MKNYIQAGDVIAVAAPADVVSGRFVAIGSLFGVAQADAKSGEEVALATRGVFDLLVDNGSAVVVGDLVYMGGGDLTASADDGGDPPSAHIRVGVAVSDAVVEDGAARVKVKLG